MKFQKYNGTIKKGHKSTLISNNFCSDPKLGALPMSTRWMFLGIVLTCGDLARDTVEMSSKQLRNLLECNRNIDGELDQLQEIQVLSYTKNEFLLNRKEKKVIEKKRKELVCPEPISSVPDQPKKSEPKFPIKFSENKIIEVKQALLVSWSDTYPKEYLDMEFKKARSWVIANDHKTPKSERGWAKFLNSWLNRGWDQYRKTLESNPPKVTVEDLEEMLGKGI